MVDFDAHAEQRIESLLIERVGKELFRSNFSAYLNWIKPWQVKVNQLGSKVVVVAGSNGKGQVAYALSSYLQQAGVQHALWSSPHILSVRERFSYQGELISYNELEHLIEQISSRVGYSPSYYELLFAVFLEWITTKECKVIILEVGLGGRLDATNIFPPAIVAIPSISREHTAILGHYYREILAEKLAVAQQANYLFTTFKLLYLRQLTATFATQWGVKWQDLLDGNSRLCRESFSQRNISLAQAVGEQLGIKCNEMPNGFGRGRLEEINFGGKNFFFIGAHNLDGVRELRGFSLPDVDLLLLSFSQRKREEIEQICDIFSKIDNRKEMIITTFSHFKAANEEELKSIATERGIKFINDWKEILHRMGNRKILVAGSYYFIGEVQRWLFSNYHPDY